MADTPEETKDSVGSEFSHDRLIREELERRNAVSYMKDSAAYADLYTYVQAVRLAAEDLGMTVTEPFNPNEADRRLIHQKMLSDKAKYGLPDKCDEASLRAWCTYAFTYSGKKGIATVGQVSYAHDMYQIKENDALEVARKEKSDTEKEIKALTHGKDGKDGIKSLGRKLFGQRLLRLVPITLGVAFVGAITAGIGALASGAIIGVGAASAAGLGLTLGTVFGGVFGAKKLFGWVKKINEKIGGLKKQRKEMKEKRSEAKAKLKYMLSKDGKFTKATTKQAENAAVEFKRITRSGAEVVTEAERASESSEASEAFAETARESVASREASSERVPLSGLAETREVGSEVSETRESAGVEASFEAPVRSSESVESYSASSAYERTLYPELGAGEVATKLKTWMPGYIAGKTPEYPLASAPYFTDPNKENVDAFLSNPELVNDENLPDLIYASTKTAEELGMSPEDKVKLDRLAYKTVDTVMTTKADEARRNPRLSTAIEAYVGSGKREKFEADDKKEFVDRVNSDADEIVDRVKSTAVSEELKTLVVSAVHGENSNPKVHDAIMRIVGASDAIIASGDTERMKRLEALAPYIDEYKASDAYKERMAKAKSKADEAEAERSALKDKEVAEREAYEAERIPAVLKDISKGKFDILISGEKEEDKRLIEDNKDFLLKVLPIVMDPAKAKEYGYKSKKSYENLKNNTIAVLGVLANHVVSRTVDASATPEGKLHADEVAGDIKEVFDSLSPEAQEEVIKILEKQDLEDGSVLKAKRLKTIVDKKAKEEESEAVAESALEGSTSSSEASEDGKAEAMKPEATVPESGSESSPKTTSESVEAVAEEPAKSPAELESTPESEPTSEGKEVDEETIGKSKGTTERGKDVLARMRVLPSMRIVLGDVRAMEHLSDILPVILDDGKAIEEGINPSDKGFEEGREFACLKLTELVDRYRDSPKFLKPLETTWCNLDESEKKKVFEILKDYDEKNKKTGEESFHDALKTWTEGIEAVIEDPAEIPVELEPIPEPEPIPEEKEADEIVERVGSDPEAFKAECGKVLKDIKAKLESGELKDFVEFERHKASLQIALDTIRENMTTIERGEDGEILSVTTAPALEAMEDEWKEFEKACEEARLDAIEGKELDDVFVGDKAKLDARKRKDDEAEEVAESEDDLYTVPFMYDTDEETTEGKESYASPEMEILTPEPTAGGAMAEITEEDIKFIPKACADISDKIGGMDKLAGENAGVIYTAEGNGELEERPKLGYYMACCVAYEDSKNLKGKKKEEAYSACMERFGFGKDGYQTRREPYYTRNEEGRMKRTEFGKFIATFRATVGKEKVGAYAEAILDAIERSGLSEEEAINRILEKGKEQQKKESKELKKPIDEDASESGG